MKFHIGTSGYSYKEWNGKFYPQKLPASQMLHYYSEHFPTVEINSTFRSLPEPTALQAWAADVPRAFKFAIKAPQRITHIRRLKNVEEFLWPFLEVTSVLGKQRGPLLFQLPPNFKKDLARLDEFLKLVPLNSATFEFRHESWFEEGVFDLLRKHRAALCIADTEDFTVPFIATAKWGYLRLRRVSYSNAELKKWIGQIKKQKWTDAYVFFKHEDEANGPRFARKFQELAE
jgi:uncharacterized protein YecE (DUF72 family)